MEITFENVTKSYPKVTAVNSLSLTLNKGVNALLGPNGAGKTTLMNMLADVILPTSGEIKLDGTCIQKLGKSYREKLGFLPQNPDFYPFFSGRELLKYFANLNGIKHDNAKFDELLNQVNLIEVQHRKVGGYSGGMKRRIGIAIALLNDPEILILDEPTAGLDPAERVRFRSIIGQMGNEKTVLLATHIVSDVSYISNQIILMNNGKIIEQGSKNEILHSLENHVWEVDAPPEILAELSIKFPKSTLTQGENGDCIRIISAEKPSENAVSKLANLEDAYLWYFQKEHDAS